MRLLRCGLAKTEDRIHPAHVRRQRQMRKQQQQQRQQHVGIGICDQIAACVRITHQRAQHLKVVTVNHSLHADAGLTVNFQTRGGMQSTFMGMLSEIRYPVVEQIGKKVENGRCELSSRIRISRYERTRWLATSATNA